MPHDTSLISTIVMGLVLAFIGGLAASKLKLPPLVGYLIAGIAVGPFTPGFVGDEALAGQLADIGIILLMFGVGLHFSVQDLMAVRHIAVPGAIAQIVAATVLGAGLAQLWGWPPVAAIIFGLALSVASTVVLLRALEDRGVLNSINGRIAVGWLVVEDLVMVLVLVLLPAMAGALGYAGEQGQGSSGGIGLALALAFAKLALFLGLVFVVGTRLVPWVLERVARTGSRELFTLSVLATALGIASVSSTLFDVSFALGAFFAGAVLSESEFSHQAAADSLPLKDAFAVLFFVSVGMLFDPGILVREPAAVAAVVAIILLGKSFTALAIVLAFRYPAQTALTVSASLAQIGEFSFILIGVGVSLGMVPAEARDLILAGALLSITLNPVILIVFDGLGRWLNRHPNLLAKLDRGAGKDLSRLPEADEGDAHSGHAVLVGFGRVGRFVEKTLNDQGFDVVVVDQDRRRVEALRARGVAAIYGDASTPGILKAAGTARARLLVIATPEGLRTRRIIELARLLKPGIDTAVRTQSEAEVGYLESLGVGLAIMAERELSFGLAGYALQSFGVPEDKARSIVQEERTAGEGGAFERRLGLWKPEAPEIARRRPRETGC